MTTTSRRGVGRDVAVQLAWQLNASVHYRVIERNEWHRLLGGAEINQNCRLHPAWAVQIGNWVSADAIVVGTVGESGGDHMTIATTMFDATGVVLAYASDSTVEALSAKLGRSSLVNTIRIRSRPLRGRVTVASNTLIIVDMGTTSDLKPGDLLQVDRILETASDPCVQDGLERFADLMAGVGTAEVLETGPFASLARYMGTLPARRGDLATRLEFLSCPSGFPAVEKRRK